MRTSCGALIAAIAAVAAVGCGDDEQQATAPAGGSEVRMVYRQDDGARPRTLVFRCPGEGCPRLRQIDRAALERTPADVACTEIYGGPQTARLTGKLDGRRVDARFSRSDGCEIRRWDLVVGVLAPNLPVGDTPPAIP